MYTNKLGYLTQNAYEVQRNNLILSSPDCRYFHFTISILQLIFSSSARLPLLYYCLVMALGICGLGPLKITKPVQQDAGKTSALFYSSLVPRMTVIITPVATILMMLKKFAGGNYITMLALI